MSADAHSEIWGFEVLKGQDNYKAWARRFRNGLAYEGYTRALDEKRPVAKDDEWNRFHRKAFAIFFAKIDERLTALVLNCDCLFDAWELLRNQFWDNGFTAKHDAVQKIFLITLISCDDDVGSYIQAIMDNKRELMALQCGLPDWWFTSILISNLNGKFPMFAQSIIALRKELPEFDLVAAELRKVDRMQKGDLEIMANRARWKKETQGLGQRQGQGQDREKKKDRKSKKYKQDNKRAGEKTCKKHPNQKKHGDAECWEQHPKLMPDHFRPKSKNDAPEAKVSYVAAF